VHAAGEQAERRDGGDRGEGGAPATRALEGGGGAHESLEDGVVWNDASRVAGTWLESTDPEETALEWSGWALERRG
jgi:hypothetical protein